MLTIGQCIAYVGEVLVAVAADELVIGFAVEPKTVFPSKLGLADSHTYHTAVCALTAIHDPDFHVIEVGVFGRPEMGLVDCGGQFHASHQSCILGHGDFHLGCLNHFPCGIFDGGDDLWRDVALVILADFHIDVHVGTLLRDVVVVQENTTASHVITLHGISDMERRFADEPHVTIHASMVGEVELGLFLARRVVDIVAVVGLDGNQTLVTSLDSQF